MFGVSIVPQTLIIQEKVLVVKTLKPKAVIVLFPYHVWRAVLMQLRSLQKCELKAKYDNADF